MRRHFLTRDGIAFHNVADLQAVDGKPGLRLQRVPDAVRDALNPTARDGALCPSSCELRFVPDGTGDISVTLYSDVHHEYVQVLRGGFVQEEIALAPGEMRTLSIAPSPLLREIPPPHVPGKGFASGVIRLKISGTGRVHYVGVTGADVRPPSADETPAHTWLAYGSSITHGFSAPRLSQPYIHCAARSLGVDVLNLGFGGACHVEPELADHFEARGDWDLATLEMGINLIEHPMPDEEFARRVAYMVDTLTECRPGRPVVLLTVFPVHHDLRPIGDPRRERAERFRGIVRDAYAVRRDRRPDLHLIEGAEVLDDWTGLSADLCHPSEYGHARMGLRLAERLRPLLPGAAR
jgi:lysophospholipase L1-like esterase